ncbi:MAG: mobile mystery protein B [Alphaproteobacteria bacterium]|nr:mobile mystery protein B [Alphaproteobacteria bacterium]
MSDSGHTLPDDISGLKLKIPFVTREQINVAEARNIADAMAKLLVNRHLPDIDIVTMQKLHRQMFGKVWTWAGEFRTVNTNIGSPATRIQEDLIILLHDLAAWDKTLESGVRLHHRAVQIHPFRNGNGRWARLVMDIWLRKNCGLAIAWPADDTMTSSIRNEYIWALKQADKLEYGLLEILHERYVYSV